MTHPLPNLHFPKQALSKLAMVAATASLLGVVAPVAAQDISAEPTYGEKTLRSGFTPDPWTVDLQAGGSIDAAQSIGGDCNGTIADAPDLDIHYTAGAFPLYFSVTAEGDTTLVINAPDGNWYCNDDYSSLDPAVLFSDPESGVYNIWVGTYSGSGGFQDASLHISEVEVVTGNSMNVGSNSGGLDFSLPANFGTADLSGGFQPDPYVVEISAGGSVNIQEAVGDVCEGIARGYASAAPDFSVNYTDGSAPLYFTGSSDRDTTMVINGPDGRWHCDDDGADSPLDPQIIFNNPQVGRYDVWIGTYSDTDEFPASTLYVSARGLTSSGPTKGPSTSLNWDAAPTYGSTELNAGFLPDPHTVGLDAGGTYAAATEVGDHCRGYVAEVPDYAVYYSAGSFPLYFTNESNTDTTMVVRSPNGQWSCDDDSNGSFNPQIVFDNPETGLYTIWVGTYSSTDDYPRSTLYVSEVGSGGNETGGYGDIDPTLDPSYGHTELEGGFTPDPFTVSLNAGGSQEAYGLGGSCNGMIASAPDYKMTYSASDWPLYISASSNRDTTLVVQGPDGTWFCSDDYSGLNPALDFQNPQSGLYSIWVGTFATTDERPPATLYISELEAQF